MTGAQDRRSVRWKDRLRDIGMLLRWRRRAANAWKTDLPQLSQQRKVARRVKYPLDTLIHIAETRLALPLIGGHSFPVPKSSDWVWRPEVWRGPLALPGMASVPSGARLGEELGLFHDCGRAEILLRQLRNRANRDLSAYGLRLEVFRFEGSYLSMVVELPRDAARDLTKDHLVRMDVAVQVEKRMEIFARLNIKNGPNTEQIVRELPLEQDEVFVEFDLAYSRVNEKRVERMWVDLIFEAPQMNEIMMRDLVFSRSRRAAL